MNRSNYEDIVSNKDFKVIFGITYIEDDHIKTASAEGRRSESHGEVIPNDGRLYNIDPNKRWTWRYNPMTNTIYWWEPPTKEVKTDAEIELSDLTDKPRHKRIYMRGESERTQIAGKIGTMDTHDTSFMNVRKANFPTFAQWLKFHRDGD